MRNIHNAVDDVLEELGIAHRVQVRVELDPNNHVRYLVYFVDNDVSGSMMEIEVIDTDNEPTLCVLNRTGFSERSMCRIMDELEHFLTPVDRL